MIGGVTFYVLHDLAALDIEPHARGIRVSCRAIPTSHRSNKRDGVLYVNPGSAGPRRFTLPITAAELLIDGVIVTAHIRELTPR